MNSKYLDFAVTPYALADVMLAFDNMGIRNYTVTKEDDDLHVRVERKYVERVVYGKATLELGGLNECNAPSEDFKNEQEEIYDHA